MSEDTQNVAESIPAPKSKQFLIMADELHVALLGKLMPGLLYVQVEGMEIQGNSDHMLLVNPIAKTPLAPMITTDAPSE